MHLSLKNVCTCDRDGACSTVCADDCLSCWLIRSVPRSARFLRGCAWTGCIADVFASDWAGLDGTERDWTWLAVLKELKRTLEMGPPRGGSAGVDVGGVVALRFNAADQ